MNSIKNYEEVHMKKNLWILLILIITCFFMGCDIKPNVRIDVSENNIIIENLGKKDLNNLQVRSNSRKGENLIYYTYTIEELKGSESVSIAKSDLVNNQGQEFPEEKRLQEINIWKVDDTGFEVISQWTFTPELSDFAGYTFYTSDKRYKLEILKRSNENYLKFISYKQQGNVYQQDYLSALEKGSLFIKNGKIELISGNYIWDANLKNDELDLQLRKDQKALDGVVFVEFREPPRTYYKE